MKEVAVVTACYPSRFAASDPPGELESTAGLVADFATELSRLARVHVVAAAGEDHVENRGDMSVHRFAVPRRPFSALRATDPANWPTIGAWLRAGQRALEQVANETPLDHVLAIWGLPAGLWARRLGRRRGVGYSTWELASQTWGLRRVPAVRSVLRSVLRDASHRFADGALLATEVAAMCGSGCEFLPTSRRSETWSRRRRAGSPPYRLAFLGPWQSASGADLLLDALLGLDEADWRAIEEVRYFGDGPLAGRVRDGIRQLTASCRPVTVGGHLDRERSTELYRWADFLLLPSRGGSVAASFCDAVQCGTPLIATPVGDMPRLIEGYGVGVLAREASGAALRDAIRAALANPPLDVERGCERAVADFDVGAAAKRFYEAALARG